MYHKSLKVGIIDYNFQSIDKVADMNKIPNNACPSMPKPGSGLDILRNGISLVLFYFFSSCAMHKPMAPYQPPSANNAPDYSKLDSWAAHPEKSDPADETPEGNKLEIGINKPVDVFFLHPSSLLGTKKNQKVWNADIADESVNKTTDEGAILFQASAFNQAGNVFAPRYRQAHYYCYFSKDTADARCAFDLAYEDVKAAFKYFLDHYNQGRPIIIASHSQGTTHAQRLLKEFFDGTPLQSKLVACYLLGMPVKMDEYDHIPPCTSPDQTACINSWRTFRRGFELPSASSGVLVTNPISWTLTPDYISKEQNPGSIVFKFNKVYPNSVDAQIHNGILWATRPKFPGSFLVTRKNYHPADVNFYYFSIRENAVLRATKYLKTEDRQP